MKYEDKEVLQLVTEELSNSTGGMQDTLEANRQNAMAAYLGDKGKVVEGRSQVVSTDVADAIEWIMPEVMKSFTQNNEVVTFDPISPTDKDQAEMESRFVYDILMKENPGFINLYTFFKDALLQKNGFMKVFYEDESKVTTESYSGLTNPELNMLMSDPAVEIVQKTEVIRDGISIIDVKVKRTYIGGRVRVIPVAPECFRVSRKHGSLDLSHARFCADTTYKTKSELLQDGFDKDVVDVLPTIREASDSDRDYRWSMMGESVSFDDFAAAEENTIYEVTECYMFMDYEGTGVAERYKITVAGFSNPTHILSIEKVPCWPYVSTTPVIMSHKLYGISVYDRLKEIQKTKTALWRNILDNAYLQNNQRTIVVEGQVNLDDVLVSRPGGIIRATNPNAVVPYQTPALSGDIYKMMDYLDQVRAGRSGVSPEGSIHDTAMGDSVGSQGLEQLLSQKEELVGLMIRVFAETGVKPICCKIRDLLINHRDVAQAYEFRGKWVNVTPNKWVARTRTTIRVGTGSGNRKEQAAAVLQVLNFQSQILAQMPGQALVDDSCVFRALDDFAKLSGMPGAAGYFLDPTSPEGQEKRQSVDASSQQQQQQELQEKQMLAHTQTTLAQAEQVKAQAAADRVQLMAQIENLKQQLLQQQNDATNQLTELKHQLDAARIQGDNDYKQQDINTRVYQIDTNAQLKREEMAQARQLSGGDGDGTRTQD